MNTPASTPVSPLQSERRGAFWFARLNRPEKRNALSEALLEALGELCDRVAGDPDARALVIWGAGGHFCVGADFARFLELMVGSPAPDDATLARHNRGFGILLERLTELPVPTVAIVRGAAMGGGFGLAAACDRVIACDDAVFSMPEVTIGVAPAQIAPFVIRRLGPTRGRWLMLGAARLSAAEALAAGLADVVVPAAEINSAVTATLNALAAAEPGAMRATKRLVNRTLHSGLTEALDAAALDFAKLLRSGAPVEGIAATRQKRPPAWRVPLPELPEFT